MKIKFRKTQLGEIDNSKIVPKKEELKENNRGSER